MSSFRRPELLYPDSGTSVQPARTIEATASSLNLPPLRCIDPLQRSTDQHTQGPDLTTQLRSAGLPPISQYHPQLAAVSHHDSLNSGYSPWDYRGSGTSSTVQMNLLPHPPLLPIAPSESHRLLSGGRHKKEVKRRTKTGCLTCRRRRIKVGHLSLSFRCGCGLSMCLSKNRITHESWHLVPKLDSGLCRFASSHEACALLQQRLQSLT
jgi:hypothetical protein